MFINRNKYNILTCEMLFLVVVTLCSHDFYSRKQNNLQAFWENATPISWSTWCCWQQPPHLALRHVTVAAVPNGPCAATGVAILAYIFITSLIMTLQGHPRSLILVPNVIRPIYYYLIPCCLSTDPEIYDLGWLWMAWTFITRDSIGCGQCLRPKMLSDIFSVSHSLCFCRAGCCDVRLNK